MKILVKILLCLLPSSAVGLWQYQRLHHRHDLVRTKASHGGWVAMRMNPASFAGTRFTITEFPRPALRRVPNAPIAQFDDAFVVQTREMMDVMYGAQGVGLAAPQVGLNRDFFVYNPSGNRDRKHLERVVCNPTITQYSPEVDVAEEGCLSLRSDECGGQVARASWIQVDYRNELGQKIARRLSGFEARVFQHEYDHLRGILCWDRFPPEDRQVVQKTIDELLGLYREDDARIDPDPEQARAMRPPPLTAKRMPPLQLEPVAPNSIGEKPNEAKSNTGFGGGGKVTANNKKKKKK